MAIVWVLCVFKGAYAITQLFLGWLMVDEKSAILGLLLAVTIALPFSQLYCHQAR